MKKTVLLCLCLCALSAGAFENYSACEECRNAPPALASDETMAGVAEAWAETTNDAASRLGGCVVQKQIAEEAALEDIERWSTILFKFRNHLDPAITKASCYSEVFEHYASGKLSGTASNCAEFGDHPTVESHGPPSPVIIDTHQALESR